MWTNILALITALLPYLKKWLEDLFKQTEEKLKNTPPSVVQALAAQDFLFKAKTQLWFWQVAKKRVLDKLIREVPTAIAKGHQTLHPSDQAEFGVLMSKAAKE